MSDRPGTETSEEADQRPRPGDSEDGPAFGSGPVERLIVLSDGVFSIAMTLLALDLIPESTEQLHADELTYRLLANWPPVLSFVVSFWLISLFWRAHTELFRWIQRRNRTLTRLNLLLLMLVCFLPYPTAILGDHGPETPAVVFYSVSIVAVGLVQIMLCSYVLKRPDLLRGGTPAHLVGNILLRTSLAVTVFGVAGVVAFVDPLIAMLFWFCSPLIRPFAEKRFLKAYRGR